MRRSAAAKRWLTATLSVSPPGRRGLGLGTVAVRAVEGFFADDMASYAAALAFQALVALFPFIIFLLALLGVLHETTFFDWLARQARLALPGVATGRIQAVVGQVRARAHGGLLSVGIVGAVWVASGGLRALMHALNVAYDVEESRPLWRRYTLSIVFTLGLAAMVVAATALMLVGPRAAAWLAGQIGWGRAVAVVWAWLRVPVASALLTLAVAVVYDVAPNVDQPFLFLTPGAVVAVLGWVLASLAFSAYVSHFSAYGATYGSLGAAIVLLLYLYLSALTMLLGAEINGAIHQHHQSSRASHAGHHGGGARGEAGTAHKAPPSSAPHRAKGSRP